MKLYSAVYSFFNPFDVMFPTAQCIPLRSTVNDLSSMIDRSEPGLLILHGGSDIHPSLYARPNVASGAGQTLSLRDQFEVRCFLEAVKAGIPIVGICRGAQLGCALAGGILVQDVGGHGYGSHYIRTVDDKTLLTNSIHHQMMYPWEVEHKLLGWSAIPRSEHYTGISDDEFKKWPKKEFATDNGVIEGFVEPEIVWFPKQKCLAIQGHPEMLDAKSPLNVHLKGLLDAYCFAH